jgi:hypothetical protein
VLLVPVDVFLRRVDVDWAELLSNFIASISFAALWVRGLAPSREGREEKSVGTLLATKQRVKEDRERAKEDDKVRQEFRKRLDEGSAGRPEGQSVFDAPKGGGPTAPRRGKETVTPSDGPVRPTPGGSLGGLKEAKKRARQKMDE